MSAHFSITRAARNGFHFAVDHARYLAQAGLLLALTQFLTTLLIFFYRPDASNLEITLWGLPAAALTGWYAFLIARLMLLGERRDRLPPDAGFRQERLRALQVSALIYVLFNMGMSVLQDALFFLYGTSVKDPGFLNYMAALMTMVVLLWSVRFGILPLASAVGFPMREFLIRVHGFEFSVRLMFLVLLCAMPVFFAFSLLASPFIQDPLNMEPAVRVVLSGLSAVTFTALMAIVFCSCVFALREILGNPPGKGRNA